MVVGSILYPLVARISERCRGGTLSVSKQTTQALMWAESRRMGLNGVGAARYVY